MKVQRGAAAADGDDGGDVCLTRTPASSSPEPAPAALALLPPAPARPAPPQPRVLQHLRGPGLAVQPQRALLLQHLPQPRPPGLVLDRLQPACSSTCRRCITLAFQVGLRGEVRLALRDPPAQQSTSR